MRTTHHDRPRCAQNADHPAHNLPFSAFFVEVICTLGTTPPQTVISPPPKGGNGVIRDPTRRRHAVRRPRVVQNPPPLAVWRAPEGRTPGRSASNHEKARPARPLHRPFREKTLPTSTKTRNLGCFKRAGRTYSRFRDHTTPQGELFRAQMKPTSPLLARSRVRMKPTPPLLTHNAAKSSISCEQRCQRFQPTTKTGLQRCQRFQPGKALHRKGKQCTR